MALVKTITSPFNGHADKYWRVTAINIDVPSQVAVVILSGYRDADWRRSGGQPNQAREIIARGGDFASLAAAAASGVTVFDVIAAAAYAVARQQDEFADAVDG